MFLSGFILCVMAGWTLAEYKVILPENVQCQTGEKCSIISDSGSKLSNNSRSSSESNESMGDKVSQAILKRIFSGASVNVILEKSSKLRIQQRGNGGNRPHYFTHHFNVATSNLPVWNNTGNATTISPEVMTTQETSTTPNTTPTFTPVVVVASTTITSSVVAHTIQEIKDNATMKTMLSEAGNKLVVVDFFSGGCIACIRIAPAFQQMAVDNPDVIFAKVKYVEGLEDMGSEFEFSAFPTFFFVKNGKRVDMIEGADKAGLERLIQKHKSTTSSPIVEHVKEIKDNATMTSFLRDAGSKLVVVDFYLIGCTSCMEMTPIFKQMAVDNPDVIFAKVNGMEVEDLGAAGTEFEFGVFPTFFLVKNGKKIDIVEGADKEGLEKLILKYK